MRLLLQSAAFALIITMSALLGWGILSPSLLLAQSDTDDVIVNLTVDSEITISSPADVTMLPNIAVANDAATGEVTWAVVTNDTDGYTLTVESATTPAMQSGGDAFDDYTETTPGTPEPWSVTGAYEFGFSAFGDDVPTGTYGTGVACDDGGAGNIPADKNYQGFTGTTPIQVASSTDVTPFAGTDSTICFAAEQEGVFAPSGSYSATITGTATVQ